MRVLCVSAPLVGHLDWGGYLPAAAALARRGHSVLWASGSAVAPVVHAAGLPLHILEETGWRWPPPPPISPAALPPGSGAGSWAHLRATRALDQWLDPARVLRAVEELSALVEGEKPDLIVSEMFVPAAGLVAERFALPFVVAGWPAHAPAAEPAGSSGGQAAAMTADARARLATILQATGLRGANISADGPPALLSPRLHLTFWSDRWFHNARLLPQTRHAGGIAPRTRPPDPTLPSPEERPWVLITLGTSFGNDPAFFRMAVEATRRMGALPLVALGGAPAPEGLHESAVLRDTFHLPALLPYTTAAIHHGGAGTTHALVLAAVPQIVTPHAGDQDRQALGVLRTGVGLVLRPEDVSVDSLERALATVLPDRAPARAAAAFLRDDFARLGGIPRAMNLLESVILA